MQTCQNKYHKDLEKQEGLRDCSVLVTITPLWHVAQWVSRAPSNHTLPAFQNLNSKIIRFLSINNWKLLSCHLRYKICLIIRNHEKQKTLIYKLCIYKLLIFYKIVDSTSYFKLSIMLCVWGHCRNVKFLLHSNIKVLLNYLATECSPDRIDWSGLGLNNVAPQLRSISDFHLAKSCKKYA